MYKKKEMEEVIQVFAPPSKSFAHRAIICSKLSDSPCEIKNLGVSSDIKATSESMERIREYIESGKDGELVLYPKESGSTLRFLIPISGALGLSVSFFPEGRLSQRPLSPLYEELITHGMDISEEGKVPIEIKGNLGSGEYEIPGNISSQFVSGLLFALPLLQGDSRIKVKGELQSEGYVDMTRRVLQDFSVKTDLEYIDSDIIFKIKGNQRYERKAPYVIEGDYSNGAFLMAGAITGKKPVFVKGLNPDSIQGDREIVNILSKFGAEIVTGSDGFVVKPGIPKDENRVFDVSQIPDLVPVIALLASVTYGKTIIKNAGRLRLKESDRLKTITKALGDIGGDVEELEDGLVITGRKKLKGGKASSQGDHRIAMMLAIASLAAEERVTIENHRVVEKSWSSFYKDAEPLGIMDNLKLD